MDSPVTINIITKLNYQLQKYILKNVLFLRLSIYKKNILPLMTSYQTAPYLIIQRTLRFGTRLSGVL